MARLRPVTAVGVLVVSVAAPLTAQPPKEDDRIKQLEKRVADLEKEVSDLRAQLKLPPQAGARQQAHRELGGEGQGRGAGRSTVGAGRHLLGFQTQQREAGSLEGEVRSDREDRRPEQDDQPHL